MVKVETFFCARFFGCRLLQQLPIPCITNLHTNQCDFGSLQHSRLHACHWGCIFQTSYSLTTSHRRCVVHSGCTAGAMPRYWNALANVQLVIGDVYVLIATACWGFYSWLLSRPDDPSEIRNNWAYFLMSQMAFGLSWSGLFTTAEWVTGDAYIFWGWPLIAALAYVALCPSLLAYRCWGLGVQQAGPNIAGFFSNLTPLFAAVMSALVLGDLPQTFHAAAFALIVGGIVVSSRR